MLCDWCTWRIRNEVILIGLGIAVYYQFMEGSLILFVFALILPVILLLPLFLIHAVGAGDIKLFSVLGGIYGCKFVISLMFSALFFGAVLSTIHMIRCGSLKVRMRYLIRYISRLLRTKKYETYYEAGRDGRTPVIHFSTAIFLAYLYSVWKGI